MRGDDGRPFPELKLAWRKIETSMYPMALGYVQGQIRIQEASSNVKNRGCTSNKCDCETEGKNLEDRENMLTFKLRAIYNSS